MVTGAEAASVADTDTVETVTGFEDLNWGVFQKNGGTNPTLLGATKGKTKAKSFVTDYLSENPKIDKETIVARPLGKAVGIRTKEVHTF